MGNTAVFAGVSTLFRIVLGLGLALLLSAKLVKCKDTLRGLFYMPTITPLVAVSFVWMWMFDPQFGMVDKITGLDINWLHDTKWAMPAVIIMTIWKDFGYATVLYLAGLMNLPRDVYEAAAIDGCGPLRTYFSVVLPMLRPTMISVGILEIMWVWNDYLLPYLVLDRTKYMTIPIHIQYLKGSYGTVDLGATMALILLSIIPVIVFYLLCQKYIIKGVAAGAVKG